MTKVQQLVSYRSRVDRNGTDFDKLRRCVRGGICAPKEVPFGDKGGCIPPCSWDKGFSPAGDTLLGSGLSGLGFLFIVIPLLSAHAARGNDAYLPSVRTKMIGYRPICAAPV